MADVTDPLRPVPDLAARAEFASDPAAESLASARLAVEHLSHHGQPLKFLGSSYGDWTEHRFGCHSCGVAVNFRARGDE